MNASDVAHAFTISTRKRGYQYCRAGVVAIAEGDAESVRAVVTGSEDYDVALAFDGRTLSAACTCPVHAQATPCKHVWATILVAEEEGLLVRAREQRRVELALEDVDAFIDGAGDDGDDHDDGKGGKSTRDGAGDDDDDDIDEELTAKLAPAARWLSDRKPPRDMTTAQRVEWLRAQVSRGGLADPARTAPSARPDRAEPAAKPPREPKWKRKLDSILAEVRAPAARAAALSAGAGASASPQDEILYVVLVPGTVTPWSENAIALDVATRRRRKDGSWSKPRPLEVTRPAVEEMGAGPDRHALSLLTGNAPRYGFSTYGAFGGSSRFSLTGSVAALVFARIAPLGRLLLQRDAAQVTEATVLAWAGAERWHARLEVVADASDFVLRCVLVEGEGAGAGAGAGDTRRVSAEEALIVVDDVVVFADRAAPFEGGPRAAAACAAFRGRPVRVPREAGGELLERLVATSELPSDLPEELRVEEVRPVPRPKLSIRSRAETRSGGLSALLQFAYDGDALEEHGSDRVVIDRGARRVLVRDRDEEARAAALLRELGLRKDRPAWGIGGAEWTLAASRLPAVVARLAALGWEVRAEGKLTRAPGTPSVRVSSGIDWFDLEGSVSYGDTSASLSRLLDALREGRRTVVLDDGSEGLLPEEWLRRMLPLAEMGEATAGGVRFKPSQRAMLDAMLALQPDADVDETFRRARAELEGCRRLVPRAQPRGFEGTLREYQKEGLAWLRFLEKLGLGGCLADDMGVGKTAQVLAMLEARRAERARRGESAPPSLVVVPRSLMFNWLQESARFTPKLRVAEHSGTGRDPRALPDADVVLTTYGTMRQDAPGLASHAIDYLILDEAQAIKNARSATAKAARLLQARHRLAMSGTPVENHLGELWSLFEFLNPGMLGSATAFGRATSASASTDTDASAALELVAGAVRPFVLRRTKQQVASELPAKTEQLLHCEMAPAQKRLYDDVLAESRKSVLELVDHEGVAKASLFVLEALLRLRQAACHPGLIDPARTGEESGKLEMLLERLREIAAEGQQALVFSQFTKLLDIVQSRLTDERIRFERLDGKTRDRQARVERFQAGSAPVFLVSLKAGGVGLNLTAAGYVFLLDPWWNPAVEAQAVDRTHRIGQTKPVFAYRLVAPGTIEEKVMQLQERKRAIADAVIRADAGLVRGLTREELEHLLS